MSYKSNQFSKANLINLKRRVQHKNMYGKRNGLGLREILSIKNSSDSNLKLEFFATNSLTKEYFMKFSNKNFIKDINLINDFKVLHKTPFAMMKEFEWLILELSCFASELKEYNQLRKKFYNSLFKNDNKLSLEILEEIDKKFGFSIWGLESRLLFEKKESNKNKKQLQEIVYKKITAETNNDYLNFNLYLSNLIIDRLTDESDPYYYSNQVNKKIKNLSPIFKACAHYFSDFHSFQINDESRVGNLLLSTNLFSIIDKYNIYLKIFLHLDKSVQYKICRNFHSILIKFDDERITRVLSLYGYDRNKIGKFDTTFTKIQFNTFKKADTSKEISEFVNLNNDVTFLLNDTIVDILISQDNELSEKLSGIFNDEFLEVIKCHREIKEHGKSFIESITKIFYLIRKYGDSDLFCQYFAYINSILLDPSFVRNIFLYDTYIGIFDFKYFTKDSWKYIFGKTASINSNVIDNIFNLKFDELQSELEVHLAMELLTTEKFNDASITENHLMQLKSSIERFGLPNFYLENLGKILFSYYWGNDEFSTAIATFVEFYFQNENVIYLFSVHMLKDVFDKKDGEFFDNSKVDTLIFSELCKSDRTKYILEDYLEHVGVQYPSELELDNSQQHKLRFIFDSICTRERLADMTLLFESEQEVIEERLSIISRLNREYDDEFNNKYTKEISEISQEILLKQLVQTVNKSKLTVESEKIFEKNKDELLKYLNAFIASEDGYVYLFSISDNISDDNNFGLKIITVNQKLNSLKELLDRIILKFLFADDGLDAYLSTRIRHGTLQGQLRSVFTKNHLITEKLSDSSTVYSENTYIKNITGSDYADIACILDDFSSSIDNKIMDIKQEIIQVSYKDRGVTSGCFNLTESFFDIDDRLFGKVRHLTDSKQIYYEVVEYIWEKIDEKVHELRELIKHDITKYFIDNLTSLESKIGMLNIDVTAIKNQIANCKTDIQHALEEVAGWFKRSQIFEDTEVSSKDLLNVSKQIIQKIVSEFQKSKLDLSSDPELTFSSKELPYYIDILLILFDNAIKHSGLSCEDLSIKLTMRKDEGDVLIIFKNNFSDLRAPIIVEAISNLEINLKNLKNQKSIPKLSQEGGSGYSKIYKIIRGDLQKEPIFNFYVDSDTLNIEIRME